MDTTEPADRWFATPDIRIHALDWGGPQGGPVVLMLHGVAGNAWVWDDVGTRLARTLPSHRIVAIDQRDGGDTDHPEAGYERTDFFRDVLAVHDALGGGPLVLVGHSRGAWLAAAFAAAHPERVGRLVLVDPARLTFASETDAGSFYDWVRNGLGPFPSEDAAIAWAMSEDPESIWTPVRRRSFLFGFTRDATGTLTGKLPIPVVDHLSAARTGGEDVTAALGSLAVPTLLLVAARQAPSRIAHKMAYAERLPDVSTLHLDGSHFLHTDVPEDVASAIENFVVRNGDPV
jgi:pimeloyl-ACP methyl ester carboxylesterase